MQGEGAIRRIVVSHLHGFEAVDLDQLACLESDNNTTHFHLNNHKRLTASKALKDYEELLEDFWILPRSPEPYRQAEP